MHDTCRMLWLWGQGQKPVCGQVHYGCSSFQGCKLILDWHCHSHFLDVGRSFSGNSDWPVSFQVKSNPDTNMVFQEGSENARRSVIGSQWWAEDDTIHWILCLGFLSGHRKIYINRIGFGIRPRWWEMHLAQVQPLALRMDLVALSMHFQPMWRSGTMALRIFSQPRTTATNLALVNLVGRLEGQKSGCV